MMKDTSETKKQFIDTVSNKYRPITVGRLDDYGRLLAKKKMVKPRILFTQCLSGIWDQHHYFIDQSVLGG